MDVRRLGSGAPVDPRRAQRSSSAPVVLFAGRAESVRGIDTLLDCFPLVLKAVPDARLRLLLIPRPELDGLLAKAHAAGLGDHLDGDRAGVGSALGRWRRRRLRPPFKYDYTTSPPAMAAAEALSVGLPTVATDVSCLRAVVEDGVNGMVVPPLPLGARSGFGGVAAPRGPVEALRRCGSDHGDASAPDGIRWRPQHRLPTTLCWNRRRPGCRSNPCGLSGPGLVAYVVSSDSTRIAVIDTWATCGLPTDLRQFKVKHAAPSCMESPAYDTQDVGPPNRADARSSRACARRCSSPANGRASVDHGSTPGAVQGIWPRCTWNGRRTTAPTLTWQRCHARPRRRRHLPARLSRLLPETLIMPVGNGRLVTADLRSESLLGRTFRAWSGCGPGRGALLGEHFELSELTPPKWNWFTVGQ